MTKTAAISRVAVLGPGLPGWEASLPVLAGVEAYREGCLPRPIGACIPAVERRRATNATRLAVDAAAQALAGLDASAPATVFASCSGEVEVIHAIFEELSTDRPVLSPTRFHNSVHNAAAGYWSIASRAQTASTSICCYDDSFGAGLLEALVQCASDQCAVLLVAYDEPPVFPIAEFRPILAPFAAAVLLRPHPESGDLALADWQFEPTDPAASTMTSPELERLRLGNPAARALPLLAALAIGVTADLRFGCGMGGTLRVQVTPCV